MKLYFVALEDLQSYIVYESYYESEIEQFRGVWIIAGCHWNINVPYNQAPVKM